jgi:prepilin peptidase CpaA
MPHPDSSSWLIAWSLTLTACAAFTDTRRGLIPNWLTLPSLCVAPLVHAWLDGVRGLAYSFGAAALCGGVPLLLFGLRAIGGGDVKLFAALGGVLGIEQGLELQLLSYSLCTIYALCLLTYRGALFATLRRSLALLASPFLPAAGRPALPATAMTQIRLGASIFVACALLTARSALGA